MEIFGARIAIVFGGWVLRCSVVMEEQEPVRAARPLAARVPVSSN